MIASGPTSDNYDPSIFNISNWFHGLDSLTREMGDFLYGQLSGSNIWLGTNLFQNGLAWGVDTGSQLTATGSILLGSTELTEQYFTNLSTQVNNPQSTTAPLYSKDLTAISYGAPQTGLDELTVISFTVPANFKQRIHFSAPIAIQRTFTFQSGQTTGSIIDSHDCVVKVYKNNVLFQTVANAFLSVNTTSTLSTLTTTKTFGYDLFIGQCISSFVPDCESAADNVYSVAIQYMGTSTMTSVGGVSTMQYVNSTVSGVFNRSGSSLTVSIANQPTGYDILSYSLSYVVDSTALFSDFTNIATESLTFKSTDALLTCPNINVTNLSATYFAAPLCWYLPPVIGFTSTFPNYGVPYPLFCSSKFGTILQNSLTWIILQPYSRAVFYSTVSSYPTEDGGDVRDNQTSIPIAFNLSPSLYSKAVRVYKYNGDGTKTEVTIAGIS
jgi:hypothetical protein